MYTTYHFERASDINEDILEAIKLAFREKAISITVKEEPDVDPEVPDWHLELALREKEKWQKGEAEVRNWEEIKNDFKLPD